MKEDDYPFSYLKYQDTLALRRLSVDRRADGD